MNFLTGRKISWIKFSDDVQIEMGRNWMDAYLGSYQMQQHGKVYGFLMKHPEEWI